MKILYLIEGHNGCALYRLQIPAKYLARRGVHVRVVETVSDGDIRNHDIIVFQKSNTQQLLDLMVRCKQMGKIVVYECDDDYFNIPVWNPAHNYYKKLKPLLQQCLKTADHLTVSTHHLRSQFMNYNKSITVLPNSIDCEELIPPDVGRRHINALDKKCTKLPLKDFMARCEGKIKIGWLGSPTHKKDLNLLVRVISKICNENKNAIFLFGGCVTQEIAKAVGYDQILFLEMVPPRCYLEYMNGLELDIGLAPLDDNIFNRSKSNLKVIEYMSTGAVPIATNCYDNYGHTIKHGKNGFLCENDLDWYESLTSLICDEELRREMSANSRHHVQEYYDIDKNIQMWIDTYSRLLGERNARLSQQAEG